MNKYQRAKSQKVKTYIKLAEIFTRRRPSYKEGKRAVRAYERFVKSWKSPVSFERRQLGYHADILILDESTPFEETPALWPKENPYLKREDIHD